MCNEQSEAHNLMKLKYTLHRNTEDGVVRASKSLDTELLETLLMATIATINSYNALFFSIDGA